MKEARNLVTQERKLTPEEVVGNLKKLFTFEAGRPVRIIDDEHQKRREDALLEIDSCEFEKGHVYARLLVDLEAIENAVDSDIADREARSVGYDGQTSSFFLFGKKGTRIPLTRGELMSDGRWGVKYRLDKSVPRETRTEYAIKDATDTLSHLHNLQIALNESTRGENDFDEEAYTEVLKRERAKENIEGGLDNGGLAEMVVLSLLERLSLDNNLPFTVQETDPYQDIKGKIDFIIHFKAGHNRGAKVNQSETVRDIGIQLTESVNLQALERKQGQIDRATKRRESSITDVVLVSIPLKDMQKLHKDWQVESKKKTPGGPDKLLSRGQQETILRGILQKLPPGVMTEQEIRNIFEIKSQSLAA